MVKVAAPQPIDCGLWRWRVAISVKWRKAGEHINILENRASGLALRWRCRAPPRLGKRLRHFLDSLVTMGVNAKGRASSRRLRPSLLHNAAYILGSNLYPVLVFTRTHRNPADRPSRRFSFNKAHQGVRKDK